MIEDKLRFFNPQKLMREMNFHAYTPERAVNYVNVFDSPFNRDVTVEDLKSFDALAGVETPNIVSIDHITYVNARENNFVNWVNRKFRDKTQEYSGLFGFFSDKELIATLSVQGGFTVLHDHGPSLYEEGKFVLLKDYASLSSDLDLSGYVPAGATMKLYFDHDLSMPGREDREGGFFSSRTDFSDAISTDWFFKNGIYSPEKKCD